MTAMHLNYTPDGQVTDRLIAFYQERAGGGTALIIVGGCTIDEYSGGTSMISLREDRFMPGLRRLTDALDVQRVEERGKAHLANLRGILN